MKITIDIDVNNGTAEVEIQGKVYGSKEFYELLGEMARIHAIKNLDYGAGAPFGNFKFSEDITGIPAWKGALVRLTDKWGRIKSLVTRNEGPYVKEESLRDTLIDNAVYSLLIITLKQ